MNEISKKLTERSARKSKKREEKMLQIAGSAIEALRQLGYANTSLRDIADQSDLSLGMLHYYFKDKTDLIIVCVRIYKESFVHGVTNIIDEANSLDDVIESLSNGLSVAVMDDAETHKLWYDIRTQAMFDPEFRPVVDDIEASLMGIITKIETRFSVKDTDPQIHYAAIDGLFRFFVQNAGSRGVEAAEIADSMRHLLRKIWLG